MSFRLPKPTGSGVRDLHTRLIKDWSARIKLDEEFRDLVHQQNRVELLPDSDDRNMIPVEVHSGRAGGIIDHGNGLLMALPTFHADPPSLITEDAREAEQVEKLVAALFQQQLLANDFWPSVGRDILIYARAFIKAMPLPSIWTIQEGYPVRGQKENASTYLERIRKWKESEGKFPFVIQHVPALSILPLLDHNDNVLATIEEKWVTAKVLAEDLGSKDVQELLERRALNWYDELLVIEYTDACYVAYLLASTDVRDRSSAELIHSSSRAYKLLRTWEHNMGKCPVVMVPGIITELSDYERHFKSFLADAKDALEKYDFLLSRMASMVCAYYLPSYEWKIGGTTAQFEGRELPTKEIILGGVTITLRDEELSVMQIPTNLPPADQLIVYLDDIIQRHTLEDVLFGRVAGSAPAFQVNLRINVAKSKLTPLAQHMAQGLTNVIDLFLRGVEVVGEAIVIGGEKITLSMAKRYRNRVTVSITPKSPVDRNQDIGAANMALQFGLPWDWIAENILEIEDPATLRLQKDILEIEQLPPVKEKLMTDALNQLEALINEDEFTDTDSIDLAQLPPEFANALQGILGGPTSPEASIQELIEGLAESPEGGGLGRGPYPEGGAPQTIQGGRGPYTPKTQPQPGAAEVGTEGLGVPGGMMV